jgi:hypothetical protein
LLTFVITAAKRHRQAQSILRLTWIGLLGGADASSAADPLVGLHFGEKIGVLAELSGMALYRRSPSSSHGVSMTVCLVAANLQQYVLHAFVVVHNHVHLPATPALALPKLTKSLKAQPLTPPSNSKPSGGQPPQL